MTKASRKLRLEFGNNYNSKGYHTCEWIVNTLKHTIFGLRPCLQVGVSKFWLNVHLIYTVGKLFPLVDNAWQCEMYNPNLR